MLVKRLYLTTLLAISFNGIGDTLTYTKPSQVKAEPTQQLSSAIEDLRKHGQESAAITNVATNAASQEYEWEQFTREDAIRAEMFKLTKAEWLRYKRLINLSPRRYWTPDIDPLVLLAVEANTEMERERYVRLSIQLQHERIQKEATAHETEQRILKELAPDSKFWLSRKELYAPERHESLKNEPLGINYRMMVFADAANCTSACVDFVNKLIRSTPVTSVLNIYIDGDKQRRAALTQQLHLSQPRLTKKLTTISPYAGQLHGSNYTFPVGVIYKADGEHVITMDNSNND